MAKKRRITPRRRAEGFGLMVKQAVIYGKWFGPRGGSMKPTEIPAEAIAMMARRAAHHAAAHRLRYPLKGEA